MGILELSTIALGLSMDACAVSVCKGLSVEKLSVKQMLITGLYFGGFQALMPLLGYFLGSSFESFITSFDHWVAFILLALIGVNMIRESRGGAEEMNPSFGVKAMLPLAVATSIDALAVGITFAFLSVDIVPAVCLIGAITFVLSIAGLNLGRVFGARFRSAAELLGGIILILMGLKILLEHLGVIG